MLPYILCVPFNLLFELLWIRYARRVLYKYRMDRALYYVGWELPLDCPCHKKVRNKEGNIVVTD